MPSSAHEVPILIFRDRPDLLLQLLGDALLASPTAYDRVEDKSNDLTLRVPVALRADLVLVFYLGGRPVLVTVVEVQRAPDADKLRAWPGYLGELVYRFGCPCYLVVVAGDEATAAWAGQPNPYFQPSSPLLPLVLSGEDIPVVASPDQAQASPEAALLSLAVHGGGQRGVEVAAAIVPVAQHWGTEYKIIIETLLTQLFDTAKRKALEARIGMDLTEWFRNHENENIRQSFQRGETKGEIKGKTEGKTEGKAEFVLKVLEARGLRLAPVQEQRIRCCQDTVVLERWLLRALTAVSVEEVLADPA